MNNKDKIMMVFEQLMNRTSLERISVKTIMEKAQLPRTEFYRYFKDKYDLMVYVYTSSIEKIIRNDQNISQKDITLACYQYMYQKKDFFSQIVRYKKQNSFLQFLNDYSYKISLNSILGSYNMKELDFDLECSLKMFCAGSTHLVEYWLENGLINPPEQMAEIVDRNIPLPLKKYLDGAKIILD